MAPAQPPRSSRRRVPRAEREVAMLDAAGLAFADHGFHRASMDAIAAAAGISKPMLYAYFDSKEGLYAAYIERSGQGERDEEQNNSEKDELGMVPAPLQNR